MSEPVSTPTSNKGPRPQDLDAAALRHQARRLARAGPAPWLHVEVARRMAERLSFIKLQPNRVLDASPALGASSEVLRLAYPKADMCWHEADPALAGRAARDRALNWWRKLRGAGSGQVQALPARPEVELLWSNMALHACADLPEMLAQWQASIAVGGFVMFSCLGPDSFVELRPLYARAGWGRPGPDWWDMHDIGDLLVGAGFADPVMDQERITLTWGDATSLLKDLRALGGNLAPQRFAGLRGKTWHQELLAALEGLRGADGRLRLSLEVVYGHAFKPVPKIRLSAESHVSMEQMREMIKQGRKP